VVGVSFGGNSRICVMLLEVNVKLSLSICLKEGKFITVQPYSSSGV
jgi:hypothetical protein